MKTGRKRSAHEHFQRFVEDLVRDRDPAAAFLAPDWSQAVAQVGQALYTKLGCTRLPRRMRRALHLVHADAVTLDRDGRRVVRGTTHTYTLAPDCPCPDAKQGATLCTHAIAATLYGAALKLVCPF